MKTGADVPPLFSFIFSVICNQLVQRARIIVHPRHQTSDVYKVSAGAPGVCAGCLQFLAKSPQKFILARIVDVTVKHPSIPVVIMLVKWDRVVTHDNVPAGVLDFKIVGNFFKARSVPTAKPPRVGFPPRRTNLPLKLLENSPPIFLPFQMKFPNTMNGAMAP